MTPKEKAKELVNKFEPYSNDYDGQFTTKTERKHNAKQCALIAVDEIIDLCWEFYGKTWDNTKLSYYQEVKQEIQKL